MKKVYWIMFDRDDFDCVMSEEDFRKELTSKYKNTKVYGFDHLRVITNDEDDETQPDVNYTCVCLYSSFLDRRKIVHQYVKRCKGFHIYKYFGSFTK